MVLGSLPWWSGLARQQPRWFMVERAAWLSALGCSLETTTVRPWGCKVEGAGFGVAMVARLG